MRVRNRVVWLALLGVVALGCKKKDEGAADAEAEATAPAAAVEDAAVADAAVAVEEAGVDAATAVLPRPTTTAATPKPTTTVTPAIQAICDRAASARDRGSPAAPGLEKQCVAGGGTVPPPSGGAAPAATAPKPATTGEPAVCARARTAKEKGSPAAAGLEAQCRAQGGTP